MEILCDGADMQRLQKIIDETGTTRSFLVRKAVRLYLENRDQQNACHEPDRRIARSS